MIELLLKKDLLGIKHRITTTISIVLTLIFSLVIATIYYFCKFGFQHILNIDQVTINIIIRLFSIGILILTPAVIISSLFSGIYTLFESPEQEYIFKSPSDISKYFLYQLIKISLHSSAFPILLITTAIASLSSIMGYDEMLSIHVLLAISIFFFSLNFLLLSVLTLCFKYFKAARFKEWIFIFLIAFSAILVLILRLSSPERLVNTQNRMEFYNFISTLRFPVSPFSPPSWISQSIYSYINTNAKYYVLYSLLLIILGIFSYFFAYFTSKKYYFKAWQNYRKELLIQNRISPDRLYSKSILGALLKKEWYSLKNDRIQFSQLILLSVLIIIYFFNLYALPVIPGKSPQYLFVIYFNIFFSIMICAALSSRFIYPSLSMEGHGINHILGIINMKTIIKSKAVFYGIPLFILSIFLSLGGLIILGIDTFTFIFTSFNTFLLSALIIWLSLKYSLKYRNPDITSPDQMIFSYGSVKLMIVVFIISSSILILELPLFLHHFYSNHHFFWKMLILSPFSY